MSVGILSDTHGHLDERVLAAANACDAIVHAGDVGTSQVLDALAPRGGVVAAVRGNNDTPAKWLAGEHARLAQLEAVASLPLPGGELVVVHGDRHGPSARLHGRLRRAFPGAAAVAYGHTHRLVCDTGATPWVLNPGAAGRARTFGGPSCLILVAAAAGWSIEPRRFPLPARPHQGLRA